LLNRRSGFGRRLLDGSRSFLEGRSIGNRRFFHRSRCFLGRSGLGNGRFLDRSFGGGNFLDRRSGFLDGSRSGFDHDLFGRSSSLFDSRLLGRSLLRRSSLLGRGLLGLVRLLGRVGLFLVSHDQNSSPPSRAASASALTRP
jgi:hypothetical protein